MNPEHDVNTTEIPAPDFTYTSGPVTIEYNVQDIVAFQASTKYVDVYLRGEQRKPMWDWSLKRIAEDPRFKDDFIQIHRGTLIRLSEAWALRREPGGCYSIELFSGITLAVSRRYVRVLRPAMMARDALTPVC